MIPDRHLDLGCGTLPRNPYGRSSLYGIDLRSLPASAGITLAVADLCTEPVPFPDNFFGSISAFDYLEHMPRVLLNPSGSQVVFPFINLMSEIHRVLSPGGRFYALTPCYPSPAAFQDPTHVNIITPETHAYFCGDIPTASIYGFSGRFKLVRAEWAVHEDSRSAQPLTWVQKARRLKKSIKGQLSHFLWELEKY